MSTDMIGAIAASTLNPEVAATSARAALAPTSNFSQLVTQGLQQVNEQLQANQVDLQRLAAGDASNLHQIMIRMEESRVSFSLMMQVRSRMLEAYQDIMKMQI